MPASSGTLAATFPLPGPGISHPRTTPPRIPAGSGGFRRVQVEPDHVVELVHEQRVVGHFEPVGQVRFEAEPFPNPADGGLRQSAAFSHLLPGPMGRASAKSLSCAEKKVDRPVGEPTMMS